MPKRTTTRKPSSPATRTRRAVTAGALLPLVLGVASTQLPRQKPTTPTTTTSAVSVSQSPNSFFPPCTLPFKGERNPASDDHCGIKGGSDDPGKQAESIAKNNFCAPMSDADVMDYAKLIDLQTQSAGIPKNLQDRKVVENLGEGNYVSYVAIIKQAHYSDTTGGENVNCNISGNAPNDIHIVLMNDPNETDECKSTTAEMSPHFRPANWTPAALNAIAKKKTPVRIKGQLFFDNSHAPCTDHSRPNPKRASLWEIHPVYSIEVCKSDNLEECRNSTDPNEWTLLE